MRQKTALSTIVCAACIGTGGTLAFSDTYSITYDAALREEPATGRVILFFISESGPEWAFRRPISGPFFESPQPIVSIGVENWSPGEPLLIDATALAFPSPLDQFEFRGRVQAILDLSDNPERSHEDGPGNLYSDVLSVDLSPEREDHHWIELTNKVEPRKGHIEQENLRWVEFRSEMLSDFYGRDVYHRAGVALPMGYLDEDAPREVWPAMYVIPGYGGREEMAVVFAGMFRAGASIEIPQAVMIVLDPESPLGHHGFTDTENHGPRGTALVREFIPHLESQFKLAERPEGRIVTGHSSGGWTSLWLQINWPEVFGACWSSAPDPIDFEAFQMSNLYEDDNLYFTAEGEAVPSYREIGPEGEDVVRMTVRQEMLMEHAMHPQGGSGQQWDAWMAMFSPKDTATGFPARLADPMTGKIHREVVEHWKKFDIARIVTSDWGRYGPIVTRRVRLACGDRDSYYLERAVQRFKSKVDALRGDNGEPGDGYIRLVEGADHSTIQFFIQQRWMNEMRAHLRKHGLHD